MKTITLLFIFLKNLLIFLFVYTAVSKLIGYKLFHEQLTQIPLIGSAVSRIGWIIPAGEIAAALLLSYAKTEIVGYRLSAVLLILFAIYILAMLYLAPALPCSCGGIIETLSWQQHLVINVALAAACLYRLHHHKKSKSYAYKGVS
jgi:hypothetical protein